MASGSPRQSEDRTEGGVLEIFIEMIGFRVDDDVLIPLASLKLTTT